MICDKIISDRNCNTIVQNEEFDPHYAYIYILQLNKHSGETFSQTFVKTKEDEDIVFNIGQDGFYTLCRLKIVNTPTEPYYYKDGRFYKGLEEVSLAEVLAINPEVSHAEITYYYYFQLCKLRKCFINIASRIINNTASIQCETRVNSQDSYKRDLLWAAINVITYLAEMEQFEEAERLLERITGCNGLCDNETNNCSCGCGG